MSTETTHALHLTRTIAASPDRVFEAWTQPQHLSRWSCPEGVTLEAVEVDLQVGGAYKLCMRTAEGQTHTAVGTYRTVEPPHRLAYTWDWVEEDQRMGETLVTVEFNATADGGTEVVLTHEGFPAAEAREGHDQGWTSCLDKLEGVFA